MSFPNILELVPHRPPMLWIDEVISQQADEICCQLTVRDSHIFVEAGRVEALIAIEWMAQAVAALVGLYDHRSAHAPRPGFLIAIPEATLHVPAFQVGDVLEIRARRLWGDASLASFESEVHRAGQLSARAQLSVYRPARTEGPDT